MKRSCYKLFLLPLSPKLILAPAIANTRLSSWPLSAWARQAHRGDVSSQGEVLHHQQQGYVVVEVVIVKAGVDLKEIQLHKGCLSKLCGLDTRILKLQYPEAKI